MATDIDSLIAEAITLKAQVDREGPSIAEARLTAALSDVSENYDLNTLVPGDGNEMGMAATSGDGRGFLEAFKARIRANLCDPKGEFTKLIRTGLHTSVGATLTSLVAVLGLPAGALPLLVPVAVLITFSGMEAFCEVSS